MPNQLSRRKNRVSKEARRVEFRAEADGRLDKLIVARLPEFSRSRIQSLIRDGQVFVDGTPVGKAGLAVETGQQVEIHIPETRPSTLAAESIPLNVVFENEVVLVIDKPAGMVVHPAAGHAGGTLANAALAHAPEMEGIGGEQRPGIVHRLDKNTSGLLVIAKNEAAHRWLVDQFKDRNVEKTYIALVDGAPPTPTGRVEAPIGRSSANRQMMAVVPDAKGRSGITEYRTRQAFTNHTLLEVHPITGRTHQIRVHMAFLGCPVAGDIVYGHR
jgi:23S rRNA pseudouridine1911/1915/1917 synthase